jgi:hypothetical protein
MLEACGKSQIVQIIGRNKEEFQVQIILNKNILLIKITVLFQKSGLFYKTEHAKRGK